LITGGTNPLGATSSAQFVVNPGTAAVLVVTQQPPGTSTAGTGFGLQVVARDTLGNLATGFTGQVGLRLLGGDAAAMLSGTRVVTASGGVADVTGLSVDSAATGYLLVAADSSASPSLTADTSAAFDIIPGPVGQLEFTTQPGDTPANTPMANVVVTARDALGNPVAGASTDVVMTIGSDPVGSSLLNGAPSVTVNTSTGVATFVGLTIDQAGSPFQLRVTVGLVTILSSPFTSQ
jgi:hypothetical protein